MSNKKKRNTAKRATKKQMAAIIAVVFNVNTGFATGSALTPGMSKVFWAPMNAITAQPEPTDTYGTPGATAETTGSWTFASESGFSPNGFIDLKNDLLQGAEITWGNDGDFSSPAQKSQIAGRIMGLTSEIVERTRDMAGVPGVFAVKTPECQADEYWIVGCSCAPAYWKWKGATDKLGGSKGKGGEFEVMANCTPYKWTGTLPLKTVA